MVRGDFAEHRQADARWSRLDRGLATSRPWLLQEAGGILSQYVTSPLVSQFNNLNTLNPCLVAHEVPAPFWRAPRVSAQL